MFFSGATQAFATNYYVATSGNDANNGTQSWTAFKTIKKAVEVAKGGDVIRVESGTYSDAFDVVGIQNSSATLEFRADYPGNAVISGRVRVINSNNITFTGFDFEGPDERPMIWSGSYDGLLINCQFPSGDEALLVQDGSVTFDNCTITNFTHDGLQVDGAALVTLRQSTISTCQENGIEIRKAARVVLDESTVRDNAGDGIQVVITGDSIDIGETGGGGIGPNKLFQDAVALLQSADPTTSSGDDQLDQAIWFLVNESQPANRWNDDWHLDLNSGDDVYAGTNDALEKLMQMLNEASTYGVNAAVDAAIRQAISWIMDGDEALAQLAIDEAIAGGGDAGKINDAQSELARGQQEEQTEKYDKAAEHYFKAWLFSKEAGGTGEGTLSGGGDPPPPSPPTGWVPSTEGELVISSSSVTGNANAVNLLNQQSFDSRYSDFSSNTAWGLLLWGTSRVEDCTINNNAAGGIWLKEVDDSDLTVNNNTIANNAQFGVFCETCDLTFDSANIVDWAISGSAKAFAANGGSLTFDGVTVSGGSTAGVHVASTALTVRNAVVQANGYGIAADDSAVTVENSTVTSNSVGMYLNQSTLTVRNSQIQNNTLWGAAVYPGPTPGATATFENVTIDSNLGGLTLVGGSDGDLFLRSGTVIRDNSDTGIHFENCNLTVADQAGGSNWRTLRNGYGIKCHLGTITLTDIIIEESSSYGVRCEDSNVTLTGCTISGQSGIYADAANDGLTVKACKFEEAASASGGWGFVRYGGDVTVSDTLFAGFDNGMFLYTAGSIDQASVSNATVANVTAYGVYLAGGDVSVQNTIIHGNNAQYGLTQQVGQLTHSHNLIWGFATAFDGTSAEGTELLKNPRFVDAAANDFHLAKGSPAINSGADLGVILPTDLDGNSRPSSKVFEIGAYEYMSPNGSVRVLEWREIR